MAGEKFIYGQNPYFPIDYWSNLANQGPDRTFLTQQAKQNLKALNRGDDVSSFGALNTIAQTAAMQRQQAQESGGTGAAVLESAQGGEQEGLQRAITNKAVQQVNEQQGMQDVSALQGLQQQWAGEFQAGKAQEVQESEFNNNMYLQALMYKYPQAFEGYHRSFGQDVASQVIGAALGGAHFGGGSPAGYG